jgi:hypothetical protein
LHSEIYQQLAAITNHYSALFMQLTSAFFLHTYG